MRMVSVSDILSAISDDKALVLFKILAIDRHDSDILINKIKLTRKQYYTRMSGLMKAGLVKRKNGKYFLSAFGKIVYDAQLVIENAVNNYWKLKAIDSLGISDIDNKLPKEEVAKLMDTLIDNEQIRAIIEKKL